VSLSPADKVEAARQAATATPTLEAAMAVVRCLQDRAAGQPSSENGHGVGGSGVDDAASPRRTTACTS
jgi:hypothetical protein